MSLPKPSESSDEVFKFLITRPPVENRKPKLVIPLYVHSSVSAFYPRLHQPDEEKVSRIKQITKELSDLEVSIGRSFRDSDEVEDNLISLLQTYTQKYEEIRKIENEIEQHKREIANTFVHSDEFISSRAKLALDWDLFEKWIVEITKNYKQVSHELLEGKINEIFQKPSEELIKTSEYKNDIRGVEDSIMSLSFADVEQDGLELEQKLIKVLQLGAIIEKVADKDSNSSSILEEENTLKKMLEAVIVIPSELYYKPEDLSNYFQFENFIYDQLDVKRLAKQVRKLEKTLDELHNINPDKLEISMNNVNSVDSVDRVRIGIPEGVLESISNESRLVLRELPLPTGDIPIEKAVNLLQGRLADANKKLHSRIGPIYANSISDIIDFIDSTVEHRSSPTMPSLGSMTIRERDVNLFKGDFLGGIGDLMKVKQQLKGYFAGEIAHGEMVLRGELKKRTHKRLTRTEEFFLTETEQSEETERNLESTERYELKRNAEEVIKSELDMEAGAKITLRYGRAFVGEFTGKIGYKLTQENKNQLATEYTREVIDKTVSKIQSKIREQRTMKIIHEIEEYNEHTIHNTGDDHIRGIYQWLDKAYCVDLVNYGKRLMLDFIIPDPARFLRFIAQNHLQETTSKVPTEPMVKVLDDGLERMEPLTAARLDEANYMDYATQYNISLDPPPPKFKFKSITIKEDERPREEGAPARPDFYYKSEMLPLDDGYKAAYARLSGFSTIEGSSTEEYTWEKGYRTPYLKTSDEGMERAIHAIIFERHVVYPSDAFTIDTPLAHLLNQDTFKVYFTGSFPINHSLNLFLSTVGFLPPYLPAGIEPVENVTQIPITLRVKASAFAAIITVKEQRTEEAYQKWQINTFQAIMEAYRQSKSQNEIQEGIKIPGRNPNKNREIEREEIKKHCLSMMGLKFTSKISHDESFKEGKRGYPEINIELAKKHARQISFFEQAIDWNNMVYVLYPYFWGKKSEWPQFLSLEDPDPLHEKFLKAGALRAVIPVTEKFEFAMLNFFKTGRIWDGREDRPVYGDPLYVSIIDEIKSQQGVADEYKEVLVESWVDFVPTSLVYISDDLPQVAGCKGMEPEEPEEPEEPIGRRRDPIPQ